MRKEQLSDIMQNYRLKHGLSPEQMAKRCGISRSFYYLLLKGKDYKTGEKISPSMETYESIAKGMGMTRDELISRVEGRPMFEKVIFQTATAYNVPVVKKLSDVLAVNGKYPDELDAVKISEDIYKKDKTIAFKIENDDLFPKIQKNDLVIVWLEEQYSDGDYVLTSWSGDNTLYCYKIRKDQTSTILYGNLSVDPVRLEDTSKITILGKLVFVHKKL